MTASNIVSQGSSMTNVTADLEQRLHDYAELTVRVGLTGPCRLIILANCW